MAQWKRALVTGASAGIGREIAAQLARQGTELVVVARRGDQLEELAAEVSVPCEVLVADLGDLEQLAAVEARLAAATDPIDLLVNNAGFGFQGDFHELDLERESTVVDVNIRALHRLSHVAASTTASRGHGGILNVSSIAGFVGSPGTATYAASKAFVTSFTEGLHAELKPHGVHVSALCPGFTRTEFQEKADYDTSGLPDVVWQSAADVAEIGLAGIAANKPVVVPGAKNRVGASMINALPGAARRFVVSRLPR